VTRSEHETISKQQDQELFNRKLRKLRKFQEQLEYWDWSFQSGAEGNTQNGMTDGFAYGLG
jgi:hypothetical protein